MLSSSIGYYSLILGLISSLFLVYFSLKSFRDHHFLNTILKRPNNEKPKDTLWGLAWEVETIEDTHKRLVSEGVEVSDIKAGLKENTLVATVKSHTHNVPTLIIQHL